MNVLHGVVVRVETRGVWLCVSKARVQFDLVLTAPPFLPEKERVKRSRQKCVLVCGWPRYDVETFGCFVTHVVEVDGAALNFVRLLAYVPPQPLSREHVIRALRHFAPAVTSAEITHLRLTLPERVATYAALVASPRWHRTPLSERTANVLLDATRRATLPTSLYALAPYFPLRMLLGSQLEFSRRVMRALVEEAPLALCFETARYQAAWPARFPRHLAPLWTRERVVDWFVRVQWCQRFFARSRDDDDDENSADEDTDAPPPPPLARNPLCIYPTAAALRDVRAIASPAGWIVLDEATRLMRNVGALWTSCGTTPTTGDDVASASKRARQLITRHVGFEPCDDEGRRYDVVFFAAQREVVARMLCK